MALRVALADLSTDGLQLSMPGGAGTLLLELAQGRPLGAGLELIIGPLTLKGSLEVGATVLAKHPGDGAGYRVELGHIELRGVEGSFSGASLGAERVVLEHVTLGVAGTDLPSLSCRAARVEGVSVKSGALNAHVDEIVLASGFRSEHGKLDVPQVAVGEVHGAVPELARLLTQREPPGPSGGPRQLPELPFLDHVDGDLNLDVTVDIRIPIIKSRVATHRFRVPIHHGEVNFKTVEKSLSGLEDAVLDFEVNDEGLIFERDLIPGVTFDNQTLVTWPLQGEEHVRARRDKLIRLRRLLEFRVNPALLGDPSGASEVGDAARHRDGSRVALRQLDIRDIAIGLRIGGPSELALGSLGTLRLGTEDRAAVGRLELDGEVHYSPAASRPPSELRLHVVDVFGGADLVLGDWRCCIEGCAMKEVRVGPLRAEGMEPQALDLTFRGIELSGVTVGPQGAR